MRSLFKLSLASLAAVALFAGMAFAQDKPELKWSGNIGTGFGILSIGEKSNFSSSTSKSTNSITGTVTTTEVNSTSTKAAYSEYITSWEANLRATYASDQLTAVLRFRPRGSNSGANATGNGWTSSANDVYEEIYWKPIPALQIMFGNMQGPAWSQPMSGTYLILHPLGSPEYWMNWTGRPGIDIEFNAGVVQVGVGISSGCRPSCGTGNATGVSNGNVTFSSLSESNTQTLAPHLTGKFGDISVRAMIPSTSGDVTTDDGSTVTTQTAKPTSGASSTGTTTATTKKATESLTGSGYQVGVGWSGMGGINVGADLQGWTDAVSKAQKAAGFKDLSKSGLGLKVEAAGFQLGYHTLTTAYKSAKQGSDDKTDTYMKLSYTLKVGAGAIIPEYTTRTQGLAKDGKSDVSDSLIRLVGNMPF